MTAKTSKSKPVSRSTPGKTTMKTPKKPSDKMASKTKTPSKAKSKAAPKTKSQSPALAGIPERKPGEIRYWLMKSEPEAYSIDAFKADKKTLWTGVRNYLARNFMIAGMKEGDRFLFYHSNAEPSGVMGIGKILRTNIADPSALDSASEYYDPKASEDHPIWFCAEVGYEGHLAKLVTLADIRATKELAGMALLQKGQRLSIQLVSEKDFKLILKMGGGLK